MLQELTQTTQNFRSFGDTDTRIQGENYRNLNKQMQTKELPHEQN